MKVAMVAGGQPRFTKYWVENFKRILGASKIDLYFYLWDDYILTDSELNFSDVEGTLEEKIKSVLINNVELKKLVYANEPSFDECLNEPALDKCIGLDGLSNKDGVIWAVKKTMSQRYSIQKAFELVDEEYDCVIRYRMDCYPNKKIDLTGVDLSEGIRIPDNNRWGYFELFNDQFAIGNYENMKIYCNMFTHLFENLDEQPITIQPESGLSYHLTKNKIKIIPFGFCYFMNKEERGLGGVTMYKK